jgi:hypothetical protein
MMHTAGIWIGDECVDGIEEETDGEDEDMVEQTHEVQPHSYTQLNVVDVRGVADFWLVDDVAAAGTELKLIAVLDLVECTLLLSSSMSLPCWVSRSKFPSLFALLCVSASSMVG